MAVENTQQFRGLYHVLGGVISPMDGIGPSDLEIESLVKRVEAGGVKEVILALSSTMEGDTTNFYIFRKLAKCNVKLSIIARESTLQSRKKAPVLFRTAGVITYLNRHFREKCDSAALCRIAGMSRSSLQRYFLNATGCSPRQYLLQLRISEAANLLRSTGKSIDEISEETGFGDRNYFSRQFKKITGQSPASCRKMKKNSLP